MTGQPHFNRCPTQRGVTLIELMIGLALGLLTVLVITQVFTISEGQRRSATSGSDAQVNGAMSLYALQRDIQMAGYGVANNPDALGCGITANYNGTAITTATFPLVVAPVVIESNGNSGSKITVMISGKNNFSVPMLTTEDHPAATRYFVLKSALGAAAGDMFLAVPKTVSASASCALLQVTNAGGSTNATLSSTLIPHDGTSLWNPTNVVNAFPSGSYLLNLGSVVYRKYAVSGTATLQTTDLSLTSAVNTAVDLYPQVVKIQAMYGKDTNADGIVDSYNATTPTTAAGWQQVLTIRVAVVARSGQYEKEDVTASAPLWNVGTATTVDPIPATCFTSSKCLTLDVSHLGTGTDWKHYRYKVYDTVIPLRNVLWNS